MVAESSKPDLFSLAAKDEGGPRHQEDERRGQIFDMSCGVSITIKNYHNGGGDLTLKLTGVQYSEAASSPAKLIVYRKPDTHSSRLGMFANLRKNQPGYQSLGFSELTLTLVKCDDAGVVLSIGTNVYSQVGVESVSPNGTEEQIVFIARNKTKEFRVP